MKCNPKLFDLLGHILVPVPCIIMSIYMISINSTIYWMKIVGSTLLFLGIIFLILSLVLFITGWMIYFSEAKKSCKKLKLLYYINMYYMNYLNKAKYEFFYY